MTLFDKKTDSDLSAGQLYVRALNCMLDGNKEKAMDYLKQSVRLDTNNIDAYLKLGILYRELGQASRAYRIHRELTVRPQLPKSVKVDILKHIVLDLIDLKDYKKALQ